MADPLEAEPTASSRVLLAVADATGLDPLDLPPLCDVVDPDALDAVFPVARDEGARRRGERQVSFSYAGVDVLVIGDGAVTVAAGLPRSADGGDVDA